MPAVVCRPDREAWSRCVCVEGGVLKLLDMQLGDTGAETRLWPVFRVLIEQSPVNKLEATCPCC